LLGNFSKENYSLDVNFEDINAFDETLSNRLMDVPNEIIPLVSLSILKKFPPFINSNIFIILLSGILILNSKYLNV